MRSRCGVKIDGLTWDANNFDLAWGRERLPLGLGTSTTSTATWAGGAMVGRSAALLRGREVIWTWACEYQYDLTDADEFGEIDEPAYPLKMIG
eukprot:10557576-Heterocapsa_arctica.AAC.1